MDLASLLMLMITSGLVFAAVALGVLRAGPAWDQLATRQMGTLATRADALAMDTQRLEWWLRVWGISLIATPVVFWLAFNMLPFGLALVYFVYVAPRLVLDYLICSRKRVLRDQLVTATQGLANAARAGLTLHQSLIEIARETPKPLSHELKRSIADFERGLPLKDALEQTRLRLQLEPFTLFAAAVQIALERGGRINEALDRISISLRDNQRVERKLEADTSSARRAVWILSLFPLFFLGLFHMLDPESVSLLFSTLAGQGVLIVVVAMVYGGGRLALKIMDIQA